MITHRLCVRVFGDQDVENSLTKFCVCYAHMWLHTHTKSKVLAQFVSTFLITHSLLERVVGDQKAEARVPKLFCATLTCGCTCIYNFL
jgi:hypothetical protein